MELASPAVSETSVYASGLNRLYWFGHVQRMEENRIPKRVLYMNLGTTRLRDRPRNRWQDEVREDGRIVGGEGWQEKVHNREELKKLLKMARNGCILHMLTSQILRTIPQFSNFHTTKYRLNMGFKDTLNPTTDKHSPLQVDPKVQPSFSELFWCSTWPSHEYSAKDNKKLASKHHNLSHILTSLSCIMKFSGLVQNCCLINSQNMNDATNTDEMWEWLKIMNWYSWAMGHAVAQLVEALCYKAEGHRFDPWWCQLNFSLT